MRTTDHPRADLEPRQVRAFLLSRGLKPEQAEVLLAKFARADADAAAVVAAAAAAVTASAVAAAAPAAPTPAAPALAEAGCALVPAKKLKSAFGWIATVSPDPNWMTLSAPTPFKADAPTLPGWPLGSDTLQSTSGAYIVSWEEQHLMPKLDEDVLGEAAVAAPEHASPTSPASPAAVPAAQPPLDFWQACGHPAAGVGDRQLPAPALTLSVAQILTPTEAPALTVHPNLTITATFTSSQAGTAGVELLLLSPARASRDGSESPHNLMLVSDSHSSNLAKFMPARLMPKAPSASRARPTQVQLCGTPGCDRAAFHDGLCHNQQVARPRQRRPSRRVLTEAAEGSPLCRIPAASKKRAAPTSASRASPTFVGHNFMDKPSHSPLGSVLGLYAQAEAADVEAEAEVEAAEAKNISRYRGVSGDGSGGRWRARIWHNGGDIVIGIFDNEVDAALAYDEKARELHGPRAFVNFLSEECWQPWTHEESLQVLDGVNRHGHSWAKIARDLPVARTDDAVRNHWHRLMSKQRQSSALVETATAEMQASTPPQPAPQAQSGIAEVVVPAGVLPGQQIKFSRPVGGGWIMVTVPPGVFAGQKFRMELTKTSELASRVHLRCGKCRGCVRGDCGECKNCLDKPRFGGLSIKKQACEERACSNPQEKKESPHVKAAKAKQAKAAFCTLSIALQGDDYSCPPAAQHKGHCAP